MDRFPLAEIRERTYKTLDAWWTVLLVDPLASRLVWLVQPYRWITPNRLTGLATVFGIAAAVCFATGDRVWLIAGALLFHLGFVADCMDGKIARLREAGTLLGGWYDFMFDRLRAVGCAAALMGGQYAVTGQVHFLWLAAAIIGLDLLRYVNAAQMSGVRAVLRQQDEECGTTPSVRPTRTGLKARLRARRIRPHLFSGIEFEMFVFIVAPLTGWITGVVVTAGVLLVLFEVRLILALCRDARRTTVPSALHPVPAA